MRVFYTTSDNGDGSNSVEFFDSQECIDWLESDENPSSDDYQSGEGGSYFDVPDGTTFTFPGSWMKIKTLADLNSD